MLAGNANRIYVVERCDRVVAPPLGRSGLSMKNVMGEGKEKPRSLRRALCVVPLVPSEESPVPGGKALKRPQFLFLGHSLQELSCHMKVIAGPTLGLETPTGSPTVLRQYPALLRSR